MKAIGGCRSESIAHRCGEDDPEGRRDVWCTGGRVLSATTVTVFVLIHVFVCVLRLSSCDIVDCEECGVVWLGMAETDSGWV